jgi:hypothetical protein
MVVIEIGAGIDLPSIRRIGEGQGCPIIRINPRHPELAEGAGVSLAMGARIGLAGIAAALHSLGFFKTEGETNDLLVDR